MFGRVELRSSLREAALKAGVSNATVSRVLNPMDFRIVSEVRLACGREVIRPLNTVGCRRIAVRGK